MNSKLFVKNYGKNLNQIKKLAKSSCLNKNTKMENVIKYNLKKKELN